MRRIGTTRQNLPQSVTVPPYKYPFEIRIVFEETRRKVHNANLGMMPQNGYTESDILGSRRHKATVSPAPTRVPVQEDGPQEEDLRQLVSTTEDERIPSVSQRKREP